MSENSKNWDVNIEQENLHIFWTTWWTSGKTWLSIKSSQKNKASLSLSLSLSLSGKYKFGTSYYNCQTLKQENTFQDFLVFYFGYRAKLKTWKLCKFSIFLLKGYLDLWAFVSVNFLLFFQLKLQLLSKFEVKEHFPGFPSFRFWV